MAHKRYPDSPTISTFEPSKLLPAIPEPQFPPASYPVEAREHEDSAKDFGGDGQDSEVDVEPEEEPEPVAARVRKRLSIDPNDLMSYDLAPPPPRVSSTNAEVLAERLFSADHLHLILGDPILSHSFTDFLGKFRPNLSPVLIRYMQSQKALMAVEFANALAHQLSSKLHPTPSTNAASVDTKFEEFSRQSLEELLNEALPAYVTYRMVTLVTECLVKEITGTNTPFMKELVQGLAEVYCLTDPSLADNPIVFASEEFYSTSQYGREYVIGRNCRFLQGPKTQPAVVARISKAIKEGQEVSEIILNYRRDGSPFLNLVMMAPLMDHRGNVRYFIGCQIDISNLIDGGKGLDSFKQLLTREEEVIVTAAHEPFTSKSPLHHLRAFGQMLSDEEIDVVRNHDRSNESDSGRSTPNRAPQQHARRFLGMDEPADPNPNLWPPSHFGPSGRLPGVYQNYLLVRPYPSLRIIFTSAALRIPGLSQTRLVDRIGGPQHVKEGIVDSLAAGIGVTAKISWLTRTGANADSLADAVESKPRWIHCTPLIGSDAKVGVWMVVMVEKEEVTGSLKTASPAPQRRTASNRDYTKDAWPLRGLGSITPGSGSARLTSAKLYAEYLRREGKTKSDRTSATAEEAEAFSRPPTALSERTNGDPQAMTNGMASLTPSRVSSAEMTPNGSHSGSTSGGAKTKPSRRRFFGGSMRN